MEEYDRLQGIVCIQYIRYMYYMHCTFDRYNIIYSCYSYIHILLVHANVN